MSRLCNRCECINVNGVRCHERGCPNQAELIELLDELPRALVFRCKLCDEVMEFPADADKYESLHECQEHVCDPDDDEELEYCDEVDAFGCY